MFIGSFVATPWQSNCYLVGPKENGPCVVIDPGIGSWTTLQKATDEYQLEPVAVILTHGHIDHVGDAHLVAEHFDCEVWLHPADQEMLVRPMTGLSADLVGFVKELVGDLELPKPKKLKNLVNNQDLSIAGVNFSIREAPGHTEGSCLLLSGEGSENGPVFTGDVIFAGSIGRMDMPGGSMRKMGETLTQVIPELSDDLVLLPGHGSTTTMGKERSTNPYLQPQMLAQLMEEDV